MIKIYSFEDLGSAKYKWLETKHHFSFYKYFDPKRTNFGVLKVINDDLIKANSGFPSHYHENMEIITYVKKGAITHKDSNNNEGVTKAGDIQVMSAGSGIKHSEYNLEEQDTNLYQIWITPSKNNVTPRWESKEFPKEPVATSFPLLVSGEKNRNSLFIHQDAQIYGGTINKGNIINHKIKNQAYILISKGKIKINDQMAKEGDGSEVTNLSEINIEALSDAEILIIDVPNNN